MEIDVIQVLVQAGALGIVIALMYWFLKPVVSHLVESLRRSSESYAESIRAQVEMARGLEALCDKLNGHDQSQDQRNQAQARTLEGIAKTLDENTAVLRGLSQQFQAHEGRSAARYDKQMAKNAEIAARTEERHEQQMAAYAEMVKALRGMNGK